MTPGPQHIVHAFDAELERLNATVVRMGGLAETQLANAIEALVKHDTDLAERTIAGDAEIDALEHELEGHAVNLLALRQPMADDLRSVVSALKIASDLERIGDYAKNVAKRTTVLSQAPQMQPASAIPRMAKLAQAIIKDVLDAYVARDAEQAIEVWHRDQEVDEMYTSLFRELLTYMMEDARFITPCTHLLFVAKNIERIGDHATNIAETIHFMVTGRRLEGGRPKGDRSSFEALSPPSDQDDRR